MLMSHFDILHLGGPLQLVLSGKCSFQCFPMSSLSAFTFQIFSASRGEMTAGGFFFLLWSFLSFSCTWIWKAHKSFISQCIQKDVWVMCWKSETSFSIILEACSKIGYGVVSAGCLDKRWLEEVGQCICQSRDIHSFDPRGPISYL